MQTTAVSRRCRPGQHMEAFAMSGDMPTFNYTKFSTGVNLLAQQMVSKTEQAVTVKSEQGKRVSFDRVGATVMPEKVGRAAEIAVVDTTHDRRWCTNKNYAVRDFVDEFEKLDVLNDPTNAYSVAMAAAAKRRKDKVVIDAALGTAYGGEDGTTAIPLPAAQKIAAGGTGFTLAKLLQARRIIRGANAEIPGDTLHVFYTSWQEEAFINTNEVKSSDFNRDKVMVSGELDFFAGTYFHRIEDDPKLGAILPWASNTRSCVMFLKSGVILNNRKPVYGRVSFQDTREAWQVMAAQSIGAVRDEEVKVVQIDVVETH
jgi:hypothetical protein